MAVSVFPQQPGGIVSCLPMIRMKDRSFENVGFSDPDDPYAVFQQVPDMRSNEIHHTEHDDTGRFQGEDPLQKFRTASEKKNRIEAVFPQSFPDRCGDAVVRLMVQQSRRRNENCAFSGVTD